MLRAIAVASGKGGVGKSTVALNLARALARRGDRVGLLDADLHGPDIPRMLGLIREERADHLTLWLKPGAGRDVPVIERDGIKVASVQFLIAEDQSISFQANLADLLLRRLLEADWGDLDYLVIDLPPGTADIQQRVAGLVELVGVLVVVTPQDVAHLDARKLLDMLSQRGVRVLGGVENMAWTACPHCGERIVIFPPAAEGRTIWGQVDRLLELPMDAGIADGTDGAPFDELASLVVGRIAG